MLHEQPMRHEQRERIEKELTCDERRDLVRPHRTGGKRQVPTVAAAYLLIARMFAPCSLIKSLMQADVVFMTSRQR